MIRPSNRQGEASAAQRERQLAQFFARGERSAASYLGPQMACSQASKSLERALVEADDGQPRLSSRAVQGMPIWAPQQRSAFRVRLTRVENVQQLACESRRQLTPRFVA
jgi:hypothetical protein